MSIHGFSRPISCEALFLNLFILALYIIKRYLGDNLGLILEMVIVHLFYGPVTLKYSFHLQQIFFVVYLGLGILGNMIKTICKREIYNYFNVMGP